MMLLWLQMPSHDFEASAIHAFTYAVETMCNTIALCKPLCHPRRKSCSTMPNSAEKCCGTICNATATPWHEEKCSCMVRNTAKCHEQRKKFISVLCAKEKHHDRICNTMACQKELQQQCCNTMTFDCQFLKNNI